jgi:hypothetical protein
MKNKNMRVCDETDNLGWWVGSSRDLAKKKMFLIL